MKRKNKQHKEYGCGWGAVKWKGQEIMEVSAEQRLTVSNLSLLGSVLSMWL